GGIGVDQEGQVFMRYVAQDGQLVRLADGTYGQLDTDTPITEEMGADLNNTFRERGIAAGVSLSQNKDGSINGVGRNSDNNDVYILSRWNGGAEGYESHYAVGGMQGGVYQIIGGDLDKGQISQINAILRQAGAESMQGFSMSFDGTGRISVSARGKTA